MRRYRIVNAVAGVGLMLAVAALLFLALWTGAYQGETVGLDGGEVQRSSASLIEENGARILWVLMIPVLLSAIGLLVSFRQTRGGSVALWVSAALLTVFSFVSVLSIGPFYLPATVALIAAALIGPRAG